MELSNSTWLSKSAWASCLCFCVLQTLQEPFHKLSHLWAFLRKSVKGRGIAYVCLWVAEPRPTKRGQRERSLPDIKKDFLIPGAIFALRWWVPHPWRKQSRIALVFGGKHSVVQWKCIGSIYVILSFLVSRWSKKKEVKLFLIMYCI